MDKPTVALFGSTGTMGIKALEELWKRRDEFYIKILARPSKKNKKLLRTYEKNAENLLEIVWGDATSHEDVKATIQGADWVLNCMALISPTADYCQEEAYSVNTEGIRNIVKAIESEPQGPERIRFVHTSSVATMGDRMGPVRWGRIGDPVYPSIYDYYTVTKIKGERAVLESTIQHWAILRMTFIMPTNFAKFSSLMDPILFHMPLETCMENTTDRDAGYGMVNCLDIPKDSDFWNRVYNFGGGEKMQCTGYEYMDLALRINGISSVESVTDRKCFALRNFHMQLYRDSHVLEEYLHFQRDSLDDWKNEVIKTMPGVLRLFRNLALKVRILQKLVDHITRKMMTKLAQDHRNGTQHWYNQNIEKRIVAFYGSKDAFEGIPEWKTDPKPWETISDEEKILLNHGYDESKPVLDIKDLQQVATYRGGQLLSQSWDGDMFSTLQWKCCLQHEFTARPNTILKAGHWCPTCVQPPWRNNEIAKKNPYFAQVWYVKHDPNELEEYTLAECEDIADAHLDRKKSRFKLF
jgi:nucleoside-diphosphate-sugar epimerase